MIINYPVECLSTQSSWWDSWIQCSVEIPDFDFSIVWTAHNPLWIESKATHQVFMLFEHTHTLAGFNIPNAWMERVTRNRIKAMKNIEISYKMQISAIRRRLKRILDQLAQRLRLSVYSLSSLSEATDYHLSIYSEWPIRWLIQVASCFVFKELIQLQFWFIIPIGWMSYDSYRIVLSELPLIIKPSWYCKQATPRSCPFKVRTNSKCDRLQTLIV